MLLLLRSFLGALLSQRYGIAGSGELYLVPFSFDHDLQLPECVSVRILAALRVNTPEHSVPLWVRLLQVAAVGDYGFACSSRCSR